MRQLITDMRILLDRYLYSLRYNACTYRMYCTTGTLDSIHPPLRRKSINGPKSLSNRETGGS